MISAKIRDVLHGLCKRSICLAVMLVMVVTVFAFAVSAQIKFVSVAVDGRTVTVHTAARTVGSVLEKNGITLGKYDEVYPPLDCETSQNLKISVARAFEIPLTLGKSNLTLHSTSKKLSVILADNGIAPGENDVVSPSPDTVIANGDSVVITQVFKGDVIEEEVIPYSKTFVPNSSMERGKSKITTEGADGMREKVYSVVRVNGDETERTYVGERIKTEPVREVIEYGTKEAHTVNRGNLNESADVLKGLPYIDCVATSYILTGRTASGVYTRRGVIAVDPKVIPLGTRVYVQSLDGKPDYGYAIAADTGGKIKGNKIDLWVPTYEEACQNGVRRTRVYILY